MPTIEEYLNNPLETRETVAPLSRSGLENKATVAPFSRSGLENKATVAPFSRTGLETRATAAPFSRSTLETRATAAPFSRSGLETRETLAPFSLQALATRATTISFRSSWFSTGTSVLQFHLSSGEFLSSVSGGSVLEIDFGGTADQSSAAPSLPFYAAEIDAFQAADDPVVAAPTAWGARPWGALSLMPISLGATVTLLASDCGYNTLAADDGGVRAYPAVITDGFEFVRRATISPGQALSGASFGQIKLANDSGRWDGIYGSFSVDGRAVTIYRGEKRWDESRGLYVDPSHDSLVVLFTGVSGGWTLTNDALVVTLRDASYWLERPYQPNRFGGTGEYDGNAAVAGVAIPRARGGTLANPIRNVTPVRISDSSRVIFKFSDGPGRAVTIYEGGKAVFTDDGDVGDLFSTTAPAAGHVQQDYANSAFELAAEPVHAITCDVTGEFPTAGAVTIASSIARYIQTEDMELPSANIDTASFSGAATDYPYVAGVYYGPDDSSEGIDAAARVLAGLGATLVTDRQGRQKFFALRPIADGTMPVAVLTSSNCVSLEPIDLPTDLNPRPYRVGLAWQHNWTIQRSDMNETSDAEQLQFAAAADSIKSYVDSSVAAKFARPGVLAPFGGSLLLEDDADSVLADVGPFLTGDRHLYRVVAPVSVALPLDIGDVVRLVWRFGDLRNGRLGRIVSERFRRSDNMIALEVLV